MDKIKLKKELLEMLRNDIKGMIREEKYSSMKPEHSMEDMMEDADKVKATIIGDSKEDVIKGAKMLPKVMSKADEFMKARLGEETESEDEDSKKKKKK